MGRVKSDIWIHFTEVKVGDVVRARCKGCDHEMVKEIIIMLKVLCYDNMNCPVPLSLLKHGGTP